MSNVHTINSFIGLQSYDVVLWKRHHKQWIEIWLEPRQRVWRCMGCGRSYASAYNYLWTRLRDLDVASHRVWLWVLRCRVDCVTCGIRRNKLSLAREHARCTRRFERQLFELTDGMTVTKVATMTQTTWRLVREAEIH